MRATFDCTCYVQVFNSGIAEISERSGWAIISSSSIDVYIQRMAVTVECAAIVSSTVSSSITGDRNIIHEDGIYPILVLGIFHHLHERIPVGSASDGEYPIIAGSMAVSYRHSTTGTLSCPRLAQGVLGTDRGGCKETAVNSCGTLFVNPSDEACVTITISALKATVELTVAYGDIRIADASYETTKRAIAIHGTVQGNRRATVLNGYSAIFDLSHEAGRIMPDRLAGDGTCHMQVPDGSIAGMTEGSHKFLVRRNSLVECQRMAVTVEGTTEGSSFGYSHMLIDCDVGIENCAHVVLVLSTIYHHSKLVPIVGITDDNKCRILSDGITVAKGQRYIFRVTRPRFTVCSLGSDSGGCKETVVDDDMAAAISPAHKAAVAMAIVARNAPIELTGADNYTATWLYDTYETSVGGIAIHAAVDSHRRTAILDGNSASFKNLGNETASILITAIDGSCRMQATESGIAHITEWSHIFLCPGRLIEGHSMAITIEDATIISTGIYSHKLTDHNVGIEAGVNVLCILGIINLDSEIVPVLSRANGEEVVGQLTQVVERRLALLHIHLNIVCNAGTEKINYGIALSAIGIV